MEFIVEAQTFEEVILSLVDMLLDHIDRVEPDERIQRVLGILFEWSDKDFDNRVEAIKRQLDARQFPKA